MFSAIMKRDIKAAWSSSGSAASGLAFFGMSYVVMHMAFGAALAAEIEYALLAIVLLFTLMLSLPSLLDADVEDGTLEQYLILPMSKSWLMVAKMVAYWLAHMLPVLVVMLLIMLLTSPSDDAQTVWMLPALRLFLMSLWLTSLGALASILSLMHGKGVFARAMIVLPLYLPALLAATMSDANGTMLLIQIAAALFLFPLSAWIAGMLLANTLEN